MKNKPIQGLLIVVLVAWIFDLLFWKQTPGISFVLYVGLLLAAGFYLSKAEASPPARESLWIIIPIAVFSLATLLRLEPITVFVSVLLTLALLMLFVHTFRGGRWLVYSLLDLLAIPFRLFISALTRGSGVFQHAQQAMPDSPGARRRTVFSIVRGILVALPIMVIFGALLSSADPVFSAGMENLFRAFDLPKLFEYFFRLIYILILAYVLGGIYVHALQVSQDEPMIGVEKPVVGWFLGAVEAIVILVCVNGLFAAFVVVQFQYFFGGESNISYAGLTYAEYARRGFGELVLVAVGSLLLFLGLSAVTKRESLLARRVYSGLGALLAVLIGVILASAFQRLLLYESAYGFTRLRTYPHVFMIWLGLLLLAFVVLEILGRQRAFGLALLAVCVGFGSSLFLLNVDSLIVRTNFNRARQGAELDIDYLLTLSVDSTPTLVDIYQSPDWSQALRDAAGVVLACQAAELNREMERQTWTGFHFSKWRAKRYLETLDDELVGYPFAEEAYPAVIYQGESHNCAGEWFFD